MAGIGEATRAADDLRQQGHWDAAIAAHRAITAAYPGNAVAFHNLAAILGDFGHAAAAEAAASRALQLGLDAPEAWLVCARAVQAQGRLDDAQGLYEQALRRRPRYADALRDLAQLHWMRTGAVAAALGPIDAALASAPQEASLIVLKAQTLSEVGEAAAALRLLQAAALDRPADVTLALALAQAALEAGLPGDSLAAARRATALAPEWGATQLARIDALLVLGELGRAEQIATALHARAPLDQHALARLATAWRLMGDSRYGQLYDYDALVAVEELATPAGWDDLAQYLAELAGMLHGEHRYRTHPFQQSVRQGSQLTNILQMTHRATQALAQAIDAPLRRYLGRLGTGSDPMRARNRGSFATQGGWSIRMQAGGRHVNHVHPEGWISSACYVETPPALGPGQGQLKLGEPGIPLVPLPSAERFIDPQPGRIVFFPAYMWHGTTPYTSPGVRMSVAFDFVPGPVGGASVA